MNIERLNYYHNWLRSRTYQDLHNRDFCLSHFAASINEDYDCVDHALDLLDFTVDQLHKVYAIQERANFQNNGNPYDAVQDLLCITSLFLSQERDF